MYESRPDRTEREENVQWTFLTKGPDGALARIV